MSSANMPITTGIHRCFLASARKSTLDRVLRTAKPVVTGINTTNTTSHHLPTCHPRSSTAPQDKQDSIKNTEQEPKDVSCPDIIHAFIFSAGRMNKKPDSKTNRQNAYNLPDDIHDQLTLPQLAAIWQQIAFAFRGCSRLLIPFQLPLKVHG